MAACISKLVFADPHALLGWVSSNKLWDSGQASCSPRILHWPHFCMGYSPSSALQWRAGLSLAVPSMWCQNSGLIYFLHQWLDVRPGTTSWNSASSVSSNGPAKSSSAPSSYRPQQHGLLWTQTVPFLPTQVQDLAHFHTQCGLLPQ